MTDDRSAALLLRVRVESEGAFRGRLLFATGGSATDGSDAATLAVASSPKDLVDAISAWLDDFLHDH